MWTLHIKGMQFNFGKVSIPLESNIAGFDEYCDVWRMEQNMMQAENGLYLPADLIREAYGMPGTVEAKGRDEDNIPDDTALSWEEWNAKVDRLLRECGEET